jgi:hypothetical protein
VQSRDELNSIVAGEALRMAYANTQRWRAVDRALGRDDEDKPKPQIVKHPPPSNRAERRRQQKLRGGFKKGAKPR